MTHSENGIEEFSMGDSIDSAILMHRDAHFAGSFAEMVEYYEAGGKGIAPELELARIRQLAQMEESMQDNLAAVMLSGAEAEKIQRALHAYKKLRDLYQTPNPKSLFPRLIADLIFSEEEDPKAEIEAIVAEKSAIVPFLIDLVRSSEFHDPLFPGYGQAPILAARCLGLIGDRRALISIFEEIGHSDFFDDDDLIKALRAIGQPAKEFLLKVLHGKPYNFDNERAAIALEAFKDDPEVAQACLEMILMPEVWKEPPLATYLILACENLSNKEDRQKLIQLMEDSNFPKTLKPDITMIAKEWY